MCRRVKENTARARGRPVDRDRLAEKRVKARREGRKEGGKQQSLVKASSSPECGVESAPPFENGGASCGHLLRGAMDSSKTSHSLVSLTPIPRPPRMFVSGAFFASLPRHCGRFFSTNCYCCPSHAPFSTLWCDMCADKPNRLIPDRPHRHDQERGRPRRHEGRRRPVGARPETLWLLRGTSVSFEFLLVLSFAVYWLVVQRSRRGLPTGLCCVRSCFLRRRVLVYILSISISIELSPLSSSGFPPLPCPLVKLRPFANVVAVSVSNHCRCLSSRSSSW